MLIHPWDAAIEPAEWRQWHTSTDRFGLLVANNTDPAAAPLVVPTHTYCGHGLDARAAGQQRRRRSTIGKWRSRGAER